MKWLLPLTLVSLAIIGWSLEPVTRPPEPSVLQVEGVRSMRHADHDRIDAVLARRGPGLGLKLREHLAEAIAQEAEKAGFDPLLVLALIAVESEFQENAVSVVGARGLMQIRPTTLYFVAEKEGIRLSREEIEADTALCVRLGIRYLKQMKDRFGDLELALIAYNAGPTKLYLMLKDHSSLEQFRGYPHAIRRQYEALRHDHGEAPDWTFASREVR